MVKKVYPLTNIWIKFKIKLLLLYMQYMGVLGIYNPSNNLLINENKSNTYYLGI